MCTARLLSQAVDVYALNFYLDRVLLSTILSIRKLETLEYPTVKTASLYVSSF